MKKLKKTKKKKSSKKSSIKSRQKKNYILFGAKGCGSVITEAFLRFAKIPYDYHELQWDDREHWPQIIGRYNSLPQVPTLILPNGEVLTETLATAVHAASIKKGLIPLKKSADKFWRWAVFIVANIYPTFTIRDNVSKLVSDKKAQQELSDTIMRKRKSHWLAMEEQCGKKWFLGNSFSAIDVYLGFMTYWTPGKEWFKENCPKIYAVSEKVKNRNPYKKLFQEHMDQ